MSTTVSTTYRFHALSLERVTELKQTLEAFAAENGLLGLCLMGVEGINLTVAGRPHSVEAFKGLLRDELNLADLNFRDAEAAKPPFNVFKVKVREEIVTLNRPGLVPPSAAHHHLSPAEWHEAVRDPNTLVLDARNAFEVEVGKFRRAHHLGLNEFSEFPRALAEANLPKDQRVLIYCTGGIRCEKAILTMHEQGFKNVQQLDGGILNYLEAYPEREFEGECFVFDYRVAVTQALGPSVRFDLCAQCGQPAPRAPKTCAQCGGPASICAACAARETAVTCSKNCRHHFAIGSNSRKPQKIAGSSSAR